MAWEPEQIVAILKDCGELALNIQLSARRSIKMDDTLVTEADTSIEALITERLQSAEDVFFIGEETAQKQGDEYHRAALRGSCYVIDPVDGTILYANGLPGWGISIGYMLNGKLSEGALLFPASGELLISRGPEVLYACSQESNQRSNQRSNRGKNQGKSCPDFGELRPLLSPLATPQILGQKATQGNDQIAGPVISVNQTMVKHGHYQGDHLLLSTGSCVSSMLYLIRGGITAYWTKSRLWDIAGGIPLLLKMGMSAWFPTGKAFSPHVSDEYWHIPPATSGSYWQLREPLLFCPDWHSFDAIMQDMRFPPSAPTE